MLRSLTSLTAVAALAATASAQTVFPTGPHAAFNFIPFGSGNVAATLTPVQHQVFLASLFGATPVEITKIGFAPNNGLAGTTQNLGDVTIRLGYTSRTPGVAPPTGLDIPASGGGGAPNATGTMTDFFTATGFSHLVAAGGSANFEMEFTGTPFVYDPALGNLMVEIVCTNTTNTTMSVSRAAGSAESSRAFVNTPFGNQASFTTATRMNFFFEPVTGCYADCNNSGGLTIADFICFQAEYVAGNLAYADCNQSGGLSIADFICFQAEYVAGCP